MTGHTPGPWKVWDQAPYSIWAGDTQIAACRVVDEDGDVEGYMLTGFRSEEAMANARLIAAAPALLAFAEMVEAGWKDHPVLGDKARAAIAQAKGPA